MTLQSLVILTNIRNTTKNVVRIVWKLVFQLTIQSRYIKIRLKN